jgi:hypothetical protein
MGKRTAGRFGSRVIDAGAVFIWRLTEHHQSQSGPRRIQRPPRRGRTGQNWSPRRIQRPPRRGRTGQNWSWLCLTLGKPWLCGSCLQFEVQDRLGYEPLSWSWPSSSLARTRREIRPIPLLMPVRCAILKCVSAKSGIPVEGTRLGSIIGSNTPESVNCSVLSDTSPIRSTARDAPSGEYGMSNGFRSDE